MHAVRGRVRAWVIALASPAGMRLAAPEGSDFWPIDEIHRKQLDGIDMRLKRTYLRRLDEVLPGTQDARYLQIGNKVRAGTRFEVPEAIPLAERAVRD